MNTPSLQSPDVPQTKFPSASDGLSGNQTSTDSRSSIRGPVDLQVEGTDDDLDLLALDDRFHETGLDEASIHGTGIMLVDSSF